MKSDLSKSLLVVSLCLSISTPLYAGGTEKPTDEHQHTHPHVDAFHNAIMHGTAYIDARYRYEFVDQDTFSEDANASTLRTKLGYKTGKFESFRALLEAEISTPIGDDNYNDTINGKITYPVVADPDSTEVNQAYIAYDGLPHTDIIVGRQGINLDNQRFIGTVGWRQNDQTFDAIKIANQYIAHTTLTYGFIDNVNRIFSDDHPLGNLGSESHILHGSYNGFDWGTITAYGYLLNLDEDAPALSSNTFGVRLKGAYDTHHDVKLLYTAEIASQSDARDNPSDYDAIYFLVEGGASYKGWTGKVGFESLEGDTGGSFQTPLATLHAHNGWADKFLVTPAGGLEDVYGKISYKVSDVNHHIDGTKFDLIYHDFSAESGGADYGNEWNVQVTKPFLEHYSVGLKYAHYDADEFSTDTQKFWLTLTAKFQTK